MRNQTGKRSTPAGQGGHVDYDRPQGCLLRFFRMAFGNLALLALALLIFKRHGFSQLNMAYWRVVVALGTARYAVITRFDGLTTLASQRQSNTCVVICWDSALRQPASGFSSMPSGCCKTPFAREAGRRPRWTASSRMASWANRKRRTG